VLFYVKLVKHLITVSVIVLTALLPDIALSKELDFSKELKNVPSSVQTPQALANWLSSEFSYRMELLDQWQEPQETIDSRAGDCEDFAILVSALLTRLGIPNDVIILKFRDLNIAHAVCLWRDEDGSYNFISNGELKRTGKRHIESAIGKFYPDCEKITFLGPGKYCKRTIVRNF
jgi:hypothetical protein